LIVHDHTENFSNINVEIAMLVQDLETPSVLIDLDKMQQNIIKMQALCDNLGLAFRPHVKTHKIPDIARRQIEAGAVGIACQKLTEAAVFIEAGIGDILIPYNIVGAQKAKRLADMALFNRVTVSADSLYVLDGLAEAGKANQIALRVLVELITDQNRAGTTVEGAVELAQRIDADEHLHFAGLLIYPSDPSIRPMLQETLLRLDEAGIGVDIVSGGGTGAALHAQDIPELTELRVGTYIFNDWTTVLNGWATLDDCAMTVMATVVSRPTAERAILDCGSKTLTSDVIDGGYGFIVEYPEARIYKLNEEHGYVDVSACDPRPDIGEIVHVVPVHTCVVTNLHNIIYGVRGDEIEVEWSVAARGRVW
jgi:D-serine deaminase-like pyridoxal phosphate-dependent protein